MSTAVAELLANLHLDDEIQCDATVNQLRCCAPSEYRIAFHCCDSRSCFLCRRCFTLVHVNRLVSCLYCNQPIGEWRVI